MRVFGSIRALIHSETPATWHSSIDSAAASTGACASGPVPLPIEGDLRALDGVVDRFVDGGRLAVEFETRFADAQAVLRRLMLKIRDAGFDDLLLVVADTRRNRSSVRLAHEALNTTLPVSTRTILGALGSGRHPGGSGLILL
jgi:hypothetical protein